MLALLFKYAIGTSIVSGFLKHFLGFDSARHRVPVAFLLAVALTWALR